MSEDHKGLLKALSDAQQIDKSPVTVRGFASKPDESNDSFHFYPEWSMGEAIQVPFSMLKEATDHWKAGDGIHAAVELSLAPPNDSAQAAVFALLRSAVSRFETLPKEAIQQPLCSENRMEPINEMKASASVRGVINHQFRSSRSGHGLTRFSGPSVVHVDSVWEVSAVGCCGYNNQQYPVSLSVDGDSAVFRVIKYPFSKGKFRVIAGDNIVMAKFDNDVWSDDNVLLIRGGSYIAANE